MGQRKEWSSFIGRPLFRRTFLVWVSVRSRKEVVRSEIRRRQSQVAHEGGLWRERESGANLSQS